MGTGVTTCLCRSLCMYAGLCVVAVHLVLDMYMYVQEPAQKQKYKISTHTHTHARARAHTHTHTHTYLLKHTLTSLLIRTWTPSKRKTENRSKSVTASLCEKQQKYALIGLSMNSFYSASKVVGSYKRVSHATKTKSWPTNKRHEHSSVCFAQKQSWTYRHTFA